MQEKMQIGGSRLGPCGGWRSATKFKVEKHFCLICRARNDVFVQGVKAHNWTLRSLSLISSWESSYVQTDPEFSALVIFFTPINVLWLYYWFFARWVISVFIFSSFTFFCEPCHFPCLVLVLVKTLAVYKGILWSFRPTGFIVGLISLHSHHLSSGWWPRRSPLRVIWSTVGCGWCADHLFRTLPAVTHLG